MDPYATGYHMKSLSVINNLGEENFSSPVTAEVIAPTSASATGGLTIRPTGSFNQTTQGSSLLGSVEFTAPMEKEPSCRASLLPER